MIFAVPAHTQPPRLDRGETESDRFSKRGRVDVRDPILIADPPVRKIKALPRNIAIGVRRIVRRQPATRLSMSMIHGTRTTESTHQACTNICFALSDALVVVAARTLAANFSRV